MPTNSGALVRLRDEGLGGTQLDMARGGGVSATSPEVPEAGPRPWRSVEPLSGRFHRAAGNSSPQDAVIAVTYPSAEPQGRGGARHQGFRLRLTRCTVGTGTIPPSHRLS